MTDRLIHRSRYSTTSIEINEDRTKLAIFHDILDQSTVKIAEFQIEDVWDMLRTNLIRKDASNNLALIRRQGEALAAQEWLDQFIADCS